MGELWVTGLRAALTVARPTLDRGPLGGSRGYGRTGGHDNNDDDDHDHDHDHDHYDYDGGSGGDDDDGDTDDDDDDDDDYYDDDDDDDMVVVVVLTAAAARRWRARDGNVDSVGTGLTVRRWVGGGAVEGHAEGREA
jgi:hypothetical protein